MKPNTIGIFLFIMLCFSGIHVKAQAIDTLLVYDLSAILSRPADTTTFPHPRPPVTKMNLSVYFKMNNPNTNKTIYILIGTQQDSSQFQNNTIPIVNNGGTFYMNQGGVPISQFWSNATSYTTSIPVANLQNAKWITVYLQNTSGQYSIRRYFKL